MKRIISAFATLPATLLAALFLCEAIAMSPLAPGEWKDKYHFGSEAMVGNGGWTYVSSSVYSLSAVCFGALFLVVAFLFVFAAARKRKWHFETATVIGVGALAMVIAF